MLLAATRIKCAFVCQNNVLFIYLQWLVQFVFLDSCNNFLMTYFCRLNEEMRGLESLAMQLYPFVTYWQYAVMFYVVEFVNDHHMIAQCVLPLIAVYCCSFRFFFVIS